MHMRDSSRNRKQGIQRNTNKSDMGTDWNDNYPDHDPWLWIKGTHKRRNRTIKTIFNKALSTILYLPQQTLTAILLAEFRNSELYINKRKLMHLNKVMKTKKSQSAPNYNKQQQPMDKYNRTSKRERQLNQRTAHWWQSSYKEFDKSKNRQENKKYIEMQATEKSKVKETLARNEKWDHSKQKRGLYVRPDQKTVQQHHQNKDADVASKANHASSSSNKTCRICRDPEETQKRILNECSETEKEILYEANFTGTVRKKVKIAENIEKAIELLSCN